MTKQRKIPEGALARAAWNGDINLVKDFLNQGISPDDQDTTGYSALVHAVRHNHVNIVRLLIDAGAHINFTHDIYHDTALHWASVNGHKEIVAILLEHDAHPDTINVEQNTPADLARMYKHHEVAQMIIDAPMKKIKEKERDCSPSLLRDVPAPKPLKFKKG